MATELALDSFFIMVAAVLVLFMQAGFAMLEVGFSRMKNAGAVMAKIFINLSVAAIVFWMVGWTLIYGGDNLGGWLGGFSQAFYDMDFVGGGGDYATFIETEEYNLIPGVDWFFQFAFAAVSLAIVWGTMLDRTKFIGYVIFGAIFIAPDLPDRRPLDLGRRLARRGRLPRLRRLLDRPPLRCDGGARRHSHPRSADRQVPQRQGRADPRSLDAPGAARNPDSLGRVDGLQRWLDARRDRGGLRSRPRATRTSRRLPG